MMRDNHVRHRIVAVVGRIFKLPADVVARGVSPESVAGWDSERHVQLVVALEDEFGIMFEAEEVPELTSLEQIEAIVARRA
jgi:acyl carrier protein